MSDFPLLNPQTAPDDAQPSLQAAQDAFGFVPNLIAIMAHSPALAEAYLAISGIFDKTDLSPTERQVVLLTVSSYHGCHYCVAAHSALAEMQRVPDAVVEAIREGRSIDDDRLQALRQFVSTVLDKRGWIDEADKQAFFAAGYRPRHVFDVLVGIAQKTMSNFTNHIADTPLDDAFQPYAWDAGERKAG